jgi:hypothetical protein
LSVRTHIYISLIPEKDLLAKVIGKEAKVYFKTSLSMAVKKEILLLPVIEPC